MKELEKEEKLALDHIDQIAVDTIYLLQISLSQTWKTYRFAAVGVNLSVSLRNIHTDKKQPGKLLQATWQSWARQ